LDSNNSNFQTQVPAEPRPYSSLLKVGAVSVLSALAGGLAAAWFYRNTLKRMQTENSNFRTAEDPNDEI
jgi:hypothetical protein